MEDNHTELVHLALDVARLRAAVEELQRYVDESLRGLSADLDQMEERARRLAGVRRIDVAAGVEAADAYIDTDAEV